MSADEVAALPDHLAGVTVAVRPGRGETETAALAAVARRGARGALHFRDVPAEADAALAADAALLVFEPAPGEPDDLAFRLKRALAAARGRHPESRLLVAASPAQTAALHQRGLDAYVDGFIPPSTAIAAPEELLALTSGGIVVRELPRDPATAARIAGEAASLGEWFPAGLVAAGDRPLSCGGRPIAAFLNPETLDLSGVSRACPASDVVTGDIVGATAERRDVGGLSAFLLRADVAASDRFADRITVGAARALTAEEVVARHQAAATRQASAVQREIADGRLTLTFEAPTFVAPVTITSQTTVYRDGTQVDLRQRDIRVNGVALQPQRGVPRLPIIEPERAAALPLTITLTDVYRYTREADQTLEGRRCYVITFTPRRNGKSLFSGRAWIDEQTFGMVRVAAAQTGLDGPIRVSEQTDTFAPDPAGRWLLARSEIHQTYEGASIRTPIHRLLELGEHDVNPPDFIARRAAAYSSADVMLRDTPDGLRYLERPSRRPPPAAESSKPEAGRPEPDAAGRQLAAPVTHIRTVAAGVIVDPNITQPLPFAGLSYVDFDLWHTGAQFSGFFGGSYAQASFSLPSVGGSRWQIAGRGLAIGAAYNDRAFVAGREVYTRDIEQRPAQAAVWGLRPIGSRAAIRLEYDWDYTRFTRGSETDPAFVMPRNQNAHGLGASLELQRAGWHTSLWASHTRRVGWEPWGIPGSDEDVVPQSSFQRGGVGVFRTTALSPRVTTRIDGAIVTGRGLDRFSRSSFGTFDNRLHGYPSALIRYDRGAVLRTAVSWAAAPAVRLDGFADTAAVHDPGFGGGLRNYTGFGAALECPAPFGTLFSVEWGYGVRGLNADGTRGTHVLRISGYKVF
ncbi:MAG TPA: hypothetical protein VGI12_06825 [Vicinamibacterales bacterium]